MCIVRPVVRWKRQTPNVLRFFQRDSTNEGLLGINVDNLGSSTFVRDNDVNFDLQSSMEWDRRGNPCSMAVDNNRFTVAGQWFIETLCRDHNLQRNTSASTRFPE